MRVFLVLILLVVSGCRNNDIYSNTDMAGYVAVELDRSGEEDLIRYYFGSYLQPPADPFAAGLIRNVDGRWFMASPDSVQGAAPILNELRSHAVIGWEELADFVMKTWSDVRGIPLSLQHLESRTGGWRDNPDWFQLEVTGSMSPYKRRVHVRQMDLDLALEHRVTTGEIVYPQGTWFIADHIKAGLIVETTYMFKRTDALWDYAAYNAEGERIRLVRKDPDGMLVPIQCLGCHYGSKAFEPERSFPGFARPGPSGERSLHVVDGARDPVVVAELNEHMKRADTILGLYATVYLSRIRGRVIQGTGSESDRELLRAHGLLPDNQLPDS